MNFWRGCAAAVLLMFFLTYALLYRLLNTRHNVGITLRRSVLNHLTQELPHSKNNIHQDYFRAINFTAPPCGQVCDVIPADVTGHVTKQFNCINIFLRLLFPDGKVYHPPLRYPPEELLWDYLQNGTMMNFSGVLYRNKEHNVNSTVKVFYQTYVDQLLHKVSASVSYGKGGSLLWILLSKNQKFIRGKVGIVIGTQRPWIEVLLLRIGAKQVVTVDYQPIMYHYPNLSFRHIHDLANSFLNGSQPQFDFAVSFSSIEHSGLGRYGDALNPFADLEAVAQVWCMLRESGVFFLGLPGSNHKVGELYFNGRRSYGEGRWQQIAANFKRLLWRRPTNDTYLHEICILQKV